MSELSEALGRPVPLLFAGREWDVPVLTFNDLADLEEHFGSMEAIDYTRVNDQRYVVWVILRKADPSLSDEDRRAGRFKMTLREAGEILTVDKPAEVTNFVMQVFLRSGILTPEQIEQGQAGDDAPKNSPTRKTRPARKI